MMRTATFRISALAVTLGALAATAMSCKTRVDKAALRSDTANAAPAESGRKAYRGMLLSFAGDPASEGDKAVRFHQDGLLVVDDGKIVALGDYDQTQGELQGAQVVDYQGKFITPGFIDTHIHFPQTEMIGAYGEELLKWLETYTFPTERQFKDKEYARKVAKIFLKELLRNGTTTALVFATIHKESTEALFEEADKLGMRIIVGKVMMDRNAPEYLRDTPQSSYDDSKALITQFHKKNRLLYAITPRFAPTSSPEQLEQAKKLVQECPDCYVHTHVSENKGEVAWVKELFQGVVPDGTSYLGVYDHFGLMTSRAVFAHAIHFEDADFKLIADRKSAISFCPTSNLFLGSGLFKLDTARKFKAKVGLGTDIGAGTSFSLIETLNEAYKVMKLQGAKLSSVEGFYLATLGSARALSLEDRVGSLKVGGEADFVVLDTASTPLSKFRMAAAKDWQEKLFVLMTIGDDRSVRATYVAGRMAHDRDNSKD